VPAATRAHGSATGCRTRARRRARLFAPARRDTPTFRHIGPRLATQENSDVTERLSSLGDSDSAGRRRDCRRLRRSCLCRGHAPGEAGSASPARPRGHRFSAARRLLFALRLRHSASRSSLALPISATASQPHESCATSSAARRVEWSALAGSYVPRGIAAVRMSGSLVAAVAWMAGKHGAL
jgi:hypothetical protein